MATEEKAVREPSNAYQIFILVLTVFSLLIMVALLLPLNQNTIDLLIVYDNLICVIFLIDFFLNLRRSDPKREYLVEHRGWLDLLGSIPALGFFRLTVLLRLARLSRLARIARLLRGKNKKQLVEDVFQHRGQYAAFITVLATFLVLTISGALVLQFESRSADANIKTGGGALWWSVVTITTVGYGDEYPVTMAGRVTAVFVMMTGIGIIGALASILASILVPRPESPEVTRTAGGSGSSADQLEQIRVELSELRRVIMADRGQLPP